MAIHSTALPDIDALSEIVTTIARTELLDRFGRTQFQRKSDLSLVTDADHAVQARMQAALAARWPEIGFLGEEMSPPRQRELLDGPNDLVWCLDPLDGTRNFVYAIPYFAVSLALLLQGRPVLGLVYDPIREECFTARKGAGVCLNGTPLPPATSAPALRDCTALVDFKRLEPNLAQRLAAEHPFGSQRSFGAVALDWCWIASGRGHAYLHGGQKLWDYAAGLLILNERGGHCITLEGQAVGNAALAPRSVAAALDRNLFLEWTDWLNIPACTR